MSQCAESVCWLYNCHMTGCADSRKTLQLGWVEHPLITTSCCGMLWYLGMCINCHTLPLSDRTPIPDSPKDTPFEDGTFKLTMQFSEEYPNKPPIVRFVSKMYHPNGEEGVVIQKLSFLLCTLLILWCNQSPLPPLNSVCRWKHMSGHTAEPMESNLRRLFYIDINTGVHYKEFLDF